MKITAKKIAPAIPTISLTLELTEKEAQALVSLCNHVGGDSRSTHRYLTDQIKATLEKEMDVVIYTRDGGYSVPLKGSVVFLKENK
tara:strand:- start:2410 stop:2667 length:258 start_codon:yes stop_codon:yes gene_type:complete